MKVEERPEVRTPAEVTFVFSWDEVKALLGVQIEKEYGKQPGASEMSVNYEQYGRPEDRQRSRERFITCKFTRS